MSKRLYASLVCDAWCAQQIRLFWTMHGVSRGRISRGRQRRTGLCGMIDTPFVVAHPSRDSSLIAQPVQHKVCASVQAAQTRQPCAWHWASHCPGRAAHGARARKTGIPARGAAQHVVCRFKALRSNLAHFILLRPLSRITADCAARICRSVLSEESPLFESMGLLPTDNVRHMQQKASHVRAVSPMPQGRSSLVSKSAVAGEGRSWQQMVKKASTTTC